MAYINKVKEKQIKLFISKASPIAHKGANENNVKGNYEPKQNNLTNSKFSSGLIEEKISKIFDLLDSNKIYKIMLNDIDSEIFNLPIQIKKCISDFLHGFKLFTSKEEISRDMFINDALKAYKEKQFGFHILSNFNFEDKIKIEEQKSKKTQFKIQSTPIIKKGFNESLFKKQNRSRSQIFLDSDQEKLNKSNIKIIDNFESPKINRLINKNHYSFTQPSFAKKRIRKSKFLNFSERIKYVCSPYNKIPGRNIIHYYSQMQNGLNQRKYEKKKYPLIPLISINIPNKPKVTNDENLSSIKSYDTIPKKKNIKQEKMNDSINLSLKKIFDLNKFRIKTKFFTLQEIERNFQKYQNLTQKPNKIVYKEKHLDILKK